MSQMSHSKSTLKPTLRDYLAHTTQPLPNGVELCNLLCSIAECTKEIALLVAKGSLLEATTNSNSLNVQGEKQMQLDLLSNDLMLSCLKKSGVVAGLVSEELDVPYLFPLTQDAPFLAAFDPLDGSSNIAVNGVVGTIFSILPASHHPAIMADFLQAGTQQLAAGYALYGPATMLVLTVGLGTHAFTYDESLQTFVLTNPDMYIAETTTEYAINTSNMRFWQPPVQQYITDCNAGVSGLRKQDFNMRWVASMVADVHRLLLRGGVYLYPQDSKLPAKAGRLRLLYEANPMSYLAEQAGGKSSTGRERLMDLIPHHIHQRVPVILGASAEVGLIVNYHSVFDANLYEQYSQSI